MKDHMIMKSKVLEIIDKKIEFLKGMEEQYLEEKRVEEASVVYGMIHGVEMVKEDITEL